MTDLFNDGPVKPWSRKLPWILLVVTSASLIALSVHMCSPDVQGDPQPDNKELAE